MEYYLAIKKERSIVASESRTRWFDSIQIRIRSEETRGNKVSP